MTYSCGGIRQFVKHTLGCRCSDDVFDHIEQGVVHPGTTDAPAAYRILVGNRLLVYLWESGDIHRLAHDLPGLVERGRNERDTHAYNRFRLVILTRSPEKLQKPARDLFKVLAGADNRLHLHLVNTDEAKAVLR